VTMFLANGAAPARGTPLEDLVPATMVALVAIAALAWVAISYQRGGAGWLRALARAGGASRPASDVGWSPRSRGGGFPDLRDVRFLLGRLHPYR
jgi:hypothetical protein